MNEPIPTSPATTPELLLAHVEWVRRLAAEIVASASDADDVAQETWRRALERPPRHAAQLRHWLALVTRNAARQLGRAARTRERHEARIPPPPLATSAAELVDRAQLQHRVVDAVLALPEPYRTTILYRFFENLAPTAIATRMDAPVETVKTRLKRGLAQLRDRLRGEFAQEGRTLQAALALLVGSTLVMSNTTKVGIAAAALIAVAIGVAPFVVQRGVTRDVDDGARAAIPAPAAVANAATVAAPTDPAERTGIDAPPADPVAALTAATPTRSLRGRVVDAADRPVAGAKVYCGNERTRGFRDRAAFLSDAISGNPEDSYPPWRSWTSGDDGAFEIDGLDPFFTWSVGAIHPDRGCGFVSGIALGDGNPAAAPTGIVVRLEAGTTFSLTLRDPTGSPAADRSFLLDFAGEPPLLPNERANFSVMRSTDERGELRLIPFPFRRFALSTFPSAGERALKRPWQEIPAGAAQWHVDLQLERSSALHGRGRIVALDGTPARLAETIAPFLTDAEKARPSRETLSLLAFVEDPRRDPALLQEVEFAHSRQSVGSTAPGHQYGTIDVAGDAYEVALIADTFRYLAVVARNELLGVAEIPPDGSAPDIAVDVASLPEMPALRAVHFRAVDCASGNALEYAQVSALLFEVTPAGRVAWHSLILSPDDPPAEQTFAMPIGDAILQVYRHDYVQEHVTLSVPPGDEPLDVVVPMVPSGGSLLGNVIDASGRPAPGVPLRLYVADGTRPVWRGGAEVPGRTDAQGRFGLEEIGATRHVLVAAPDDGAPVAIDADAGSTPIELQLVEGVPCTIELRSVDGTPCFASLRIRDSAGRPLIDDFYPFIRTYRPMGRSKFTLAPGRYTVEAETFGFEPAQTELVATPGATVTLDLVRLAPR